MSVSPEIEGETSPTFRRVVVDGVFGHVDSIGLSALLYSEYSIIDKVLETAILSPHRAKIKRVAEMEVIMSPMQMKATYCWFEKKIKEYEALFGKIPSPEEVQTRAKELGRER
jgi:hypothetical protein